MAELQTEVLVLGGGPGGYPAAFEAADQGKRVTLVDEGVKPGGVCLHRGCIPSKALLHVAKLLNESHEAAEWGVTFSPPKIDLPKLRNWKTSVTTKLGNGVAELCHARGVTLIQARGTFLDSNTLELKKPDGSTDRLRFETCILATGSSPAMPPIFQINDQRVMDSTSALELAEIPGTLLVVGGGYIGLEMGTVYAALGSQVTVVELTGNLLPGADRDLVRPLQKRLQTQFKSIQLNTKVESLTAGKTGITATLIGPDGKPQQQIFDRVLISIGRRPNSRHARARRKTSSTPIWAGISPIMAWVSSTRPGCSCSPSATATRATSPKAAACSTRKRR